MCMYVRSITYHITQCAYDAYVPRVRVRRAWRAPTCVRELYNIVLCVRIGTSAPTYVVTYVIVCHRVTLVPRAHPSLTQSTVETTHNNGIAIAESASHNKSSPSK